MEGDHAMIPKGCDQQGRHPEAAEAATEVGIPDEPEQDMLRVVIDDALIAIAAVGALCVIVLVVAGNM
jgi:hypothetical protein